MSRKNTVAEILKFAVEKLAAAEAETPRLDAEILLAYVLNWRRLKLYTDADKILSGEEVSRYENLLRQRAEKIPVAYLVGVKEFMGFSFAVTPAVLIPRPDTEILAQAATEFLQTSGGEKFFADLGTGSGAIAVSVLKFVKNSRAAAVDISSDALEVAEFNAKKFGVHERIKFFHGDLFEPLAGEIFDAIISNPPYIPANELAALQEEVKREPKIALDGGADGLNFYRRIVEGAPKFLLPEGLLAVEVGINQAAAVKNLIDESGEFSDAEILKDLAGIDRVVAARRL